MSLTTHHGGDIAKKRPTPEVIARAIALLQAVIEHKRNCKSRWWQKELYPISDGSYYVRPGKPDVRSDEVQLLLAARLVSFISTSSDDLIPDASLRLLDGDESRADEVIERYLATLDDRTP